MLAINLPSRLDDISKRQALGRRLLRAGAGLLALTCSACNPGSDLPPLPIAPSAPYRLGLNEQVRLITFGQEQLTGEFRVNDRGALDIPLLGAVPANGLTTAELEQNIEKRLQDANVLLHPSVAVEVLSYRPVFVLGEVGKPGQYPYQPNMTVLTAVAIAGGFTYRAQTHYASILRSDGKQPIEGRASRTTQVHPGDVIDVFERYF